MLREVKNALEMTTEEFSIEQVVTKMKDRIDSIGQQNDIDFDILEKDTLKAARMDIKHERELNIFKLGHLVYLFA